MISCPHCAELEERVAWLESELGIQRDADAFRRLKEAISPKGASGSRGHARGQSAELVMALYKARGRVLSRWQILEAVPSPTGRDRNANIVSVWVTVARASLGSDAIRSVWGRGYHLSESGAAQVAALIARAEQQNPKEPFATSQSVHGETTA